MPSVLLHKTETLKPYTALAWLWWLNAALHPSAACAFYFWCAQPTFPFWSFFSFTQSHYGIVTNWISGCCQFFLLWTNQAFFNAQFWHPFSTLGVLNILLSRYITYQAFLGHVWIIWISHYHYVTYSLLTSFFVTETSETERVKHDAHAPNCHVRVCALQSLTYILASQYAQMQLETKANYLMTSLQVPNTSFLVAKWIVLVILVIEMVKYLLLLLILGLWFSACWVI